MRTFSATFQTGPGQNTKVFCQAMNSDRARDIFHAQYGSRNISNIQPA